MLLDEMDEEDRERQELRHEELLARLTAIEKPHWTTSPVFWLTLIAAVAAAVGAYFAAVSVLRPPHVDTVEPQSSISRTKPLVTP